MSIASIALVDCPPKHGRLTESGCIANFNKANAGKAPEPDSHLWQCFRCSHGARRAGVAVPEGLATQACLQCGRPSTKLVWARHCVPCYNRRSEVRKGVNARGRYPSHLPPTISYRLTIATADKAPAIRTIEAVTAPEAVLVAALAGPVTVTRAPVDLAAMVVDEAPPLAAAGD